MTYGFYVLGDKGYRSLRDFLQVHGSKRIAFVVSHKDRGDDFSFYTAIKRVCEENYVPFFNRRDGDLPSCGVKFAIGWRWLISDYKNLIVLHDSPLPKYRGFAPVVNMLLEGEERLAVTALKASEAYDMGAIVGKRSFGIEHPMRISRAIAKMSALYSELLLELVHKLDAGVDLLPVSQLDSNATYSLWRDEHDYLIDWSEPSERILRHIYSSGDPYLGAVTTVNGVEITVRDAAVAPDVVVENRAKHVGKIIFQSEGCPVVVCGEGLLALTDFVDKKTGEKINVAFRTRFGK